MGKKNMINIFTQHKKIPLTIRRFLCERNGNYESFVGEKKTSNIVTLSEGQEAGSGQEEELLSF